MEPKNPKAEDVIAFVDRRWGATCNQCGTSLIGHDAVLGLMLGFANEPLCSPCLANNLGREPGPFLESAHQNVRRLACYRAGWAHSDVRLRALGPWPEDRIPARLRMPAPEEDGDDDEVAAPPSGTALAPTALDAALPADTEWDAGDRGCGELALELKLRIRRLEPGSRLLLTTTDAGAPADMPAWCRLTGNFLVAAEPPRFLIESRSATPDSPNP